MQTLLANKRILPTRRCSKSFSRSTATTTQNPSALHSTTALSKTSSNGVYNAAISTEEVDCFRSMRGTSINSVSSLESAMSSDLSELDERLDSIRRAGERVKKVFDKQGQAYSILVTHDEVRVCHIDDKGEYHYRHLPNTGNSSSRRSSNNADATRPTNLKRDLRTSLGLAPRSGKSKASQPRRQVVQDSEGRTLVDITPDTITVYHRGGVWRCHRFAGKIWDSDYATHVTAKMPRPWSRLRKRQRQASTDSDSDKENDTGAEQGKEELLLCSNTPGEGGQAPRAYKSYYHNL